MPPPVARDPAACSIGWSAATSWCSRWIAAAIGTATTHLFRELLYAELTRREPDMVPELHSRAAAWYEANDLPESAIEHAQHAGDADRVARLVLKVANPVWASGRLDTVLRLDGVVHGQRTDRDPAGRRRARRLDLRAHRPGGRRRTVGESRGTDDVQRHAGRREHDGEHTGIPARAAVPQRSGRDARRTRTLALDGLSPTEPVPGGHAPRSGGGRSAPR